jgi:hypothetical protein
MAQRKGATGRPGSAVEDALVDRLSSLSAEMAATPDEEFRSATRARLVAMAAVRTPDEAAVRRPASSSGALRRLLASRPDAAALRWRGRLTAGLAGAALTVTALGGLLAVSQDAHPGDLLYGVKIGGENTQLALASDTTRGVTLLDFARTRLQELAELTQEGVSALPAAGAPSAGGQTLLAAGPDVAVVVDTLGTMDAQTAEGTRSLTTQAVRSPDPAALGTLTGWAREQSAGLADLRPAIPAGAEQAFTASTDLVAAVAARGAALQEAVACAGGPAIGGTDDLGPLPAPCPPPPAPTAPTTSAAPGGGRSGSTGSTGSAPGATSTPTSPSASDTVPSGQTGLPSDDTPSSGGSSSAPGGGTVTTPSSPATGGRTPTPPSLGVPLPTSGLPLPTGSSTAPSSPPLINLPLPGSPSGSAPVCVGRLVCIGS